MVAVRALCVLLLVAASLLPQLQGQEDKKVRVYVDHTASPAELESLGKIGNTLILKEIGQVPYFQLVESSRLKELLAQQEFQQSKVRDEDVVRAAQLSGAQWVVFPELLFAEGLYSFGIRLVEIESGQIPALEQEVFSDRDEILSRIRDGTRDLLRDFARKEGLPPPSFSDAVDSVGETTEGEAAEPKPNEAREDERHPPVKKRGHRRKNVSWHTTFMLGLGIGGDPLSSAEGDGAFLLMAGARTGPNLRFGRDYFLAPHLRYRLTHDSWGAYANADVYPYDEIDSGEAVEESSGWKHHLGLGFSFGGADRKFTVTHAAILGLGLEFASTLSPVFSTYLGYAVSGKSVGAEFELGFAPREELGALWLSAGIIFGWPPLPARLDFQTL